MPSMNAVPQQVGAMSIVLPIIRGRTRLKPIQLQVEVALDYDKLLDKLRGSEGEKNIRDQQNALITSLNLRLNGVSKKRTRLYEDYAEGLLDEEEYAFAKKSYDEQYADLSRRLDEAAPEQVQRGHVGR